MERAELLIEWARGWAVSRAHPAPTPAAGGVRIQLGHAERHVTTAMPGWLADADIAFDTEVKVLGPPEALRRSLDDRWLMFPTVELMATAALAVLGNWAAGQGLRTGVLAATGQGAPLYRRLGWASHGSIAGAVFTGVRQ
ncbi:hypothetical protein [Actinoplanes sp. NPDC051411]|uniref:hypothetical protein n=1 Tax=Actinoplanes sp. NPDC051411 TaxID=3155522 RepID=UPI00342BD14E